MDGCRKSFEKAGLIKTIDYYVEHKKDKSHKNIAWYELVIAFINSESSFDTNKCLLLFEKVFKPNLISIKSACTCLEQIKVGWSQALAINNVIISFETGQSLLSRLF